MSENVLTYIWNTNGMASPVAVLGRAGREHWRSREVTVSILGEEKCRMEFLIPSSVNNELFQTLIQEMVYDLSTKHMGKNWNMYEYEIKQLLGVLSAMNEPKLPSGK